MEVLLLYCLWLLFELMLMLIMMLMLVLVQLHVLVIVKLNYRLHLFALILHRGHYEAETEIELT